jgi:hypothetical protein
MKSLYALIGFLLVFTSCASDRILKDFVKQDLKSNKPAKLVLIENKITPKRAFFVLRGLGWEQKNGDIIYSGTKLLTKTELDYLDKKTRNDSVGKLWKNGYFDADFKLINYDNGDLDKYLATEFYGNPKRGLHFFYQVSEPIYTKDRKKVFFVINKSTGINQTEYNYAILFSKENGDWKIIDRVKPTEL